MDELRPCHNRLERERTAHQKGHILKKQYNLFVRISAIILSLALLGLYVATLVFALIGTKSAQWWFRASIGATFFVPVILYMLMLVTKNRMQATTAAVADNADDVKSSDAESDDAESNDIECNDIESNDIESNDVDGDIALTEEP